MHLNCTFKQPKKNSTRRKFVSSPNTTAMAPNGYNCTAGGEGGSPCEETKAKLREIAVKFYEEHPEARDRILEEQKRRFSDSAEREKVSDGLKKFFAENPEAAAAISARTKGRQDSTETRERKSRGQKARQARLRLERLPLLVANQNRSAARWNTLSPAMENFRVDQIGDVEKIFADAKRLKEQRRSARRRAKRKLQSIAAENLSAAKLPAKIALS